MGVWNEMDISEDLKRMLNKLTERKKEMDAAKQWRAIYMLATLFSTGILLYIMKSSVLSHVSFNVMAIIGRLADFHLMLLVGLAIFSGGQLQYYGKLYKSKKEKYEKLRAETIERMYAPWITSSLSGKRDAISQAMKKEYDINLSYIN